MSPVVVTCRRTVGRARNLFSTALAVAGFLAATAVTLSFGLAAAEGSRLSFAAVWAGAVSPVLPLLAALLGMDVWADERRSGRMDILLSTSVRERDLVMGKYAGVLALAAGAVLLSLVSSLGFLAVFAPGALRGVRLVGLLPALFGILVQGALWCAVSVAMSAIFAHGAAAAAATAVALVALPRGIWAGLMAWFQEGRLAFGEMPLDAHALDMASGVVSTGVVAGYVAAAAALLFVASKCVAFHRLVGRGASGLRVSSVFAMVLAVVLCGLVIPLALRLDVTVELPAAGGSAELSARTRNILMESGGSISVTCFLPRSDARFRPVSRFLRQLKGGSEAMGGPRFSVRYVDPRWDVAVAERLLRRGVAEDSLVFERGHRMVAIPFRDGYGERACASAIRRLTTNPRRRNVYWTFGHGENRFDEYSPFGMSDIARDLSRDGFRNQGLDLAAATQVPSDCALVVVAGARDAFSRTELGRLDAYLRDGGRLLVLMGSARDEGVVSLLSSWGIRPVPASLAGAPTLTGPDVVVSDFSEHQVSAPLAGSRIVLDRPVSFVPSAAVETGAGADRLDFSPIARVKDAAVAVAVERGAGAGSDLAVRPTRIVAIGDAGFVVNGQLAARANANRDFLLNCAAYLSGTAAVGSHDEETDRLAVGFDRRTRLEHLLWTAVGLPGLVFLVLLVEVVRRRRRS